MNDHATLIIGDQEIELPILEGTEGERSFDISRVLAETGYTSYDPALANTAVCKSAITYIDGDKGILLYRGYPIEQLAEHSNYLETSYLLMYGELPNEQEYKDFIRLIKRHTMVHEGVKQFFDGFNHDAHPMAIMVGVVRSLSAFYHDSLDINDPQQREIAAHRLIAKMPTIAAWAYKYSIGQPFMYPKNSLDYASNFLHMCFAVPCEEYKINPVLARAMERIFILHADHEQNASTSTVRLAGSSGANPFACIAAGIPQIDAISAFPSLRHVGRSSNAQSRISGLGRISRSPSNSA